MLNATPRFQVHIDSSGNHGLSALPGAFQTVTITKSNGTISINAEPLGVGLGIELESVPDFLSFEVKIVDEKVVLEVIQRNQGREEKFSVQVVQIYRTLQPLAEGPDWGLMPFGFLRVMSSRFLRAYVTLGPIDVIDDDTDDDGEDDSQR